MTTLKEIMSIKFKSEYIELIHKQKQAAFDRCQQLNSNFITAYQDEQELLHLNNQPYCIPKKIHEKCELPLKDDDYLLAELNGHFN